MPKPVASYQQIFRDATGCDAETAEAIEEFIRYSSPTLDHFTRPELMRMARTVMAVFNDDPALKQDVLGTITP